ncbi:hypothetical protein [Zavarzinella formosa]|uniref:hypothetical protein n=1 Tax=Zavarzinella formosa TaxID=360055 RepID=UPI0012F95D0C|nr:hypothetical protein [Zavarzinella formosa]
MLDLYEKPIDPSHPVVCVDEGGKQHIGDVREPLPVRPGSPAKQDHKYEREGMANLFMALEPLADRRHVEVTEQKLAWILPGSCGTWLNGITHRSMAAGST